MVLSLIWAKRHDDIFFMNARHMKHLSVFTVHKLDIILSRNVRGWTLFRIQETLFKNQPISLSKVEPILPKKILPQDGYACRIAANYRRTLACLPHGAGRGSTHDDVIGRPCLLGCSSQTRRSNGGIYTASPHWKMRTFSKSKELKARN